MLFLARADAERRFRNSQELWRACHGLKAAFVAGSPTEASDVGSSDIWTSRLRPLAAEVQAVCDLSDHDPTVRRIVDALPRAAIDRGVYTEESLRERFYRMRKVARRVAMLSDQEARADRLASETSESRRPLGQPTLFRYALSYCQSFFIVDRSLVDGIGGGGVERLDQIEIESDALQGELDTYRALATAADCLDKGDIDMAVRFVNQLRGYARHVCSDWLDEARLYLETRQNVNVLLSHAIASGLGTVLVTSSK